ncbi:alpha-amylase [Epithele typhae]|uniref:alpha-amylase n=1 Tax=Epithele typhae TaxID=378194 RepID=UPI00200887EB|nr:alpha-amylase [Epithele typhae]KAH9926592.1 alpha-amylase [Epithele typhae]
MLPTLLVPALLASSAFAATAEQWQNRTIYQLVTDRFAVEGDSGPSCDTSKKTYCGGTWKGIISKLDYIQGMGFDAVWISPVTKNVEGETSQGYAYHGYWPTSLYDLNSNYGSADDLKSLSSALHERGMYLMLDVVVNHMVATTNPPDFSKFAPFASQSQFHPECWISNYANQTDVEQCWLGDSGLPLADLNTEDDSIVSTMNDWVKGLVGNYSADGIRIDTVKHVRKDFWPNFASSAGVFAMGEVLSNETDYVSPYTQVLDGVLDYPMWFPLVAAFQTSFGNLSLLAQTFTTSQSSYKNAQFHSGSFLENQDQPRFQSLATDQSLVKNAMAWPFIQDGIPILYYGQEQSYAGGSDPSNREALWLSSYFTDKPLVTHVKALNGARKAAIAANGNFLSTKTQILSSTTDSMAVSKAPLLSCSPTRATAPPANEVLVDVLSCNTVTADSKGAISASNSNGEPMVFVPASALTKGGALCGSVATGSTTSTQGGKTSGARPTAGSDGAFAWAVIAALFVIASGSSLVVG